MKKLVLLFSLFFSLNATAQINGQSFCDGVVNGSYFPLTVKTKNLMWFNTSYTETQVATVTMNGKQYQLYIQVWANGTSDSLYLREENGVIYQYHKKSRTEFIRFDRTFKIRHKWTVPEMNVAYRIISTSGKLKTPYCQYENLVVIKAKYPTITYKFYYLEGYGYIGATTKNKLVSFASPKKN